MKIFLVIVFSLQFLSTPLFSQNQEELSDSEKAVYFFIEGKIKELQLNYYQALENYKTALRYDDSPGILFAISKLYYEIDKFDESFNYINDALKKKAG